MREIISGWRRKKLALTSPTSGGRSVATGRSQTKATELVIIIGEEIISSKITEPFLYEYFPKLCSQCTPFFESI
jgi:hypothetical protein